MNISNVFSVIFDLLPTKIAYAHCDIPCGIYDPNAAQLGAHTVIRMTQLLVELNIEDKVKLMHDIARMTRIKEEHGSLIEKELGTLENDYFKEDHFKEFPELKTMFSDVVKLSAKTRQSIDLESAEKLLELVLKISEIFYKTKKLIPLRVKSSYPTQREIVLYR